jgi:hypothetical protein
MSKREALTLKGRRRDERGRVPTMKGRVQKQALVFPSTVGYKKSSLRLQATQRARLIVIENNRVTTTIGVTRTIASHEQWVTKDNRKMGSKGLRSSIIGK